MIVESTHQNRAARGGWLGSLMAGIIAAALALALANAEAKYTVLLVLVLAALAVLLFIGRLSLVRQLMLFGLGFSAVLNPNIYLTAPDIQHFGGAPGVFISLTDLAILCLWAVAMLDPARRTTPANWQSQRPLLIALALYLGFMALSLFNAMDLKLGLIHLFFEVKCAAVFCLLGFVVLKPGEQGFAEVRVIIYGVAAALLLEALVVAAEYRGMLGSGTSFLGISAGGFREAFIGGAATNRVGGTFRHPNYLATALVFFLWPLVSAYLTGGKRLRYLYVGALLAALAMLIGTLSRAGWGGAGFGFLVFMGWTMLLPDGRKILSDHKGAMVLVALALVAVLVIYWEPILDKLFYSNPVNFSSRMDLNRMAMQMVQAHPVLGVGLNNASVYSAALSLDAVYRTAFGLPPVVHNIYLLIASEIGVPGLVAFAGFLVLLLLRAWRTSRLTQNPARAQLIVGLAAGLAGFLLVDMFGPGLRKIEIAYIFWIQAGLLTALMRPGGSGLDSGELAEESKQPLERGQ